MFIFACLYLLSEIGFPVYGVIRGGRLERHVLNRLGWYFEPLPDVSPATPAGIALPLMKTQANNIGSVHAFDVGQGLSSIGASSSSESPPLQLSTQLSTSLLVARWKLLEILGENSLAVYVMSSVAGDFVGDMMPRGVCIVRLCVPLCYGTTFCPLQIFLCGTF